MKCSIVMATKNKCDSLQKTLDSIKAQKIPFPYEIIVVDDGSTDKTRLCCEYHGVTYIRVDDNAGYRNPSKVRNVGYKRAIGDVIICQSDEVIHKTTDSVKRLVNELEDKTFLLAEVWNVAPATDLMQERRLELYVGRDRKRPLFFLGSIKRKDLYAIGGNDEEFIHPGWDDDWFADCLINGIGLRPIFSDSIIGYHLDHPRPANTCDQRSSLLYGRKVANAKAGKTQWIASGGAWEL